VFKEGITTANNDLFLRQWYEIDKEKTAFQGQDISSNIYWVPYNKGGSFRKWYGNRDFIINWCDNGGLIKKYPGSSLRNLSFQRKFGGTFSALSSSKFSARFSGYGFAFDSKGTMFFSEDIEIVIAYLNSNLFSHLVAVSCPTLDFRFGVIEKLPYLKSNKTDIKDLIKLSTIDWDSYETSWDFQHLPLLGVRGEGLGVRECYTKMREQWIESTLKMQELEEENNRIFIEAYGLQDELKPDVPLKEITLTCNPYYRYGVNPEVLGVRALGVREFPLNAELEKRLLADTMKELISYAVGCMFGRYSLDKPGLVLANQGDKLKDYLEQVLGVRALGVRDSGSGEAALKPNTQNLKPSFMPDKDNVIPILEGEWFADDIVSRFTEFLKVAFGTEKYSENISFIEEALGKDLRAYFLKDFYKDHIKRYKKRPIYWLFSSPKGSFNALIYMHRYTPDTVSIMLNSYLREYIHKLRAKVSQLEHQLSAGALPEREKMLTRKEINRLKDMVAELEAWESKVILPLAEKRLEIDLDDGVKVNYAKFGEALKRF